MPKSGKNIGRRSSTVPRGAQEREPLARHTLDGLALALRLRSFPTLANSIRQARLPSDLIVVIRIAGGCGESQARASDATGLAESVVAEACQLLLAILMAGAGSDNYRILCADRHTPHALVHEHMVWLMKWLHPDRNGSASHAALASRVTEAWRSVRSDDSPEPVGAGSGPTLIEPEVRPPASRWRAVPVGIQRARAAEADRLRRLRRDVERELGALRDVGQPSTDDI